jgi:hypothetical protein
VGSLVDTVEMRSAEQLRIQLGAPDFKSITVGKVYPQGSATASVAEENARELAARPKFWAEYGPKSMMTTPDEYGFLVHAGARVIDGPRRVVPL